MHDTFQTKPYKLISFVFLLMFLFSGCGGSESGKDSDEPAAPETPVVPGISNFTGTYELQGMTIINEVTREEIDETEMGNWCGRMVITSAENAEGMIMYDHTFYGTPESYRWEILEITKDAFRIKKEGCEAWVDYILDGDNLTIIWPEGSCMEGYSITIRLARVSTSETYPTEPCVPVNTGGGRTDQGETIAPELVGTYDMLRFRMMDHSTGEVMEAREPGANWSGMMLLTTDNIIEIILSVEEADYGSIWDVLQIEDSDGDGVNDTLLVVDGDFCQSEVGFEFLPEENNTLMMQFPASPCTNNIEFTLAFSSAGSNASLNSKRPLKNSLQRILSRSHRSIFQRNQKSTDIFEVMKDKNIQ